MIPVGAPGRRPMSRQLRPEPCSVDPVATGTSSAPNAMPLAVVVTAVMAQPVADVLVPARRAGMTLAPDAR